MNRRLRRLALGLCLIGLGPVGWTPDAQAARDPRSGWMIGMGFAYGIEDFDLPGGADADDSLGFGAWAGYRTPFWVALGIQWEYMDKFDLDVPGAVTDPSLESHVFTGTTRVYLPLGRFQPFGEIGIGVMSVELKDRFGDLDDEADFVARFGGGLEIELTRAFALSLQATYVVPDGDLEDLDYVSVTTGFQARF